MQNKKFARDTGDIGLPVTGYGPPPCSHHDYDYTLWSAVLESLLAHASQVKNVIFACVTRK